MIDGTARISELARNLSRARSGEGTTAEVVEWLHAMSSIAATLPQPAQSNPHRQYTRTLLHRCEDFEILVLHWRPGCASSIHDHGGALCWLSVASGSMRVENYLRCDGGGTPGYAQIAFEGRESLPAGAVDHRQDDRHLHRCVTDDAPAISLHVYARPIESFNCFDERAQTCSQITSTYDAILTA